MAGEVEDIDSGFAFGVDERYLDIALVGTEGKGDLAEQAGYVLGDNLEQGGVCGGLGIKLEAGGHLNLEVCGTAHVAARFK